MFKKKTICLYFITFATSKKNYFNLSNVSKKHFFNVHNIFNEYFIRKYLIYYSEIKYLFNVFMYSCTLLTKINFKTIRNFNQNVL